MNTIIQDAVVNAVRRQSWFQKNANTIVTGIGALAGLLGFLATLPLPIKDEYRALIPVVAGFLTTLVTKFTINGIQPSMIDKLDEVVQQAPQIDLAAVQAEVARTTRTVGEQVDLAAAESARWVDTTVNEVLGQAQGASDHAHELAADYVGKHWRA